MCPHHSLCSVNMSDAKAGSHASQITFTLSHGCYCTGHEHGCCCGHKATPLPKLLSRTSDRLTDASIAAYTRSRFDSPRLELLESPLYMPRYYPYARMFDMRLSRRDICANAVGEGDGVGYASRAAVGATYRWILNGLGSDTVAG